MNHELVRMCNEAGVARFDVIHRHLPGGNEENNHLSVYRICGPGFEPGKSVYWAARDAGGNCMRWCPIYKHTWTIVWSLDVAVLFPCNRNSQLSLRNVQHKLSIERNVCHKRCNHIWAAHPSNCQCGGKPFTCLPLLSCCSTLFVCGKGKPVAILW